MWMKDCAECANARSGGLQIWMRHLADEHVLPTEWPSDRASRLTGAMALRPYTTVTESKKKRRKDSIPRPLNSFMLFAQHIRRNVLRVFSDASNSVISQQLGDLWRTVPRVYRNKYDEEANRLVKVHQLEFPNYKYQPKKRQPVVNTNVDQHRTTESTTKYTGTDSGHMSNMDSVTRSYSGYKTRPAFTIDRQHGSNELVVTRTDYKVSSPAKQAARTVFARHCPAHYNASSLSSVLPPLLTPATRSTVEYSCDSAYASGINSSSSSSASSPAVGELVSPTKSISGSNGCSRSSPIRRKIQFVPIRPQSQYPISIGIQQQPPTRQRFFSASNGSQLPSPPGPMLLLPQSSSSSSSSPSSSVLMSSDNDSSKMQQVFTPIYVRLDNESASTEDVVLALPPGTTVLQAMTTNRSNDSTTSPSTRRIVLTNCGGRCSKPMHLMQPIRFVKQQTPDDYSPPPPTSSSLSPLSGDAFLSSVRVAEDTQYTIRSTELSQFDMDVPMKCEQQQQQPIECISGNSLISEWSINQPINDWSSCSPSVNKIDDVCAMKLTDCTSTEMPMDQDVNDTSCFDSSCFDAMMNSIDITTFLPGAFSSTDDQMGTELTSEFTSEQQQTMNEAFDLQCASLLEVDELLSHIEHQSDAVYCTTKNSSSANSSPLSDVGTQQQDPTMFILKPDWSVVV